MTVVTIFILLALIATAVSLAAGLVSMGHGGNYDTRHSTQFMSARVVSQAIALLLITIALALNWH